MKNEKVYTASLILLFFWIYFWLVVFSFVLTFRKNFVPILYLGLVNTSAVLQSWAFIFTCTTDPGKPPTFWGFYMDEPQNRRKRYCLICHVFKPERCHHCSTCNRCVLAMDHHCPWLSSCVGYYNRRFFIQTLTYALLTLLLMLSFNAVPAYNYFLLLKDSDVWFSTKRDFLYLFHLITFFATVFFALIIVRFYRYHIKLLISNNTTIDQLDAKRKNAPIDTQFDLGLRKNVVSVMGTNALGWFLPLHRMQMTSDGVVWMIKESQHLAQSNTTAIPILG